MKQESKQDIILRLTEGLNAQQRSVPQLPAQAQARKIKVLGAKTDPQHPFAGYAVGADESADPVGDYVDEADFNPGRRGFLKKAGAVAATAAMPTGLAGAAAKAVAPAASWASTLSAPLAGLTAIDLDDIINLLMSQESKNPSYVNNAAYDPYDLDVIKKIAEDASLNSWGNSWFMNGNAAQALLEAIDLCEKKGMDDEDIIDHIFIVTKKQYMQELKQLSPEEVAKVKSQSLNPDNKSEPATSPTTGMSSLARAAGAQIGRTMKNVGKATANTVLNQPTAAPAALPAPTVSPGMQIPKQKSRVSAEQDKELGEAGKSLRKNYNPDGKTFKGDKNKMPTYDPDDAMMQGDYDQLDTVSAADTDDEIAKAEHRMDLPHLKQLIKSQLKILDKTEREILNYLYWHDQPLVQIAKTLGMEPILVHRIKNKALKKLLYSPGIYNIAKNRFTYPYARINDMDESLSPFNDDHSELDQFVKEEFNRHPDDINEESGAVVAHGYAYNRQDQRIAWTREFASEAEAKEWARRRNATVLSIVPKPVNENNPAADWPNFGTAKTYESQLAEAKQRLAEAESRYVLYFNGKPASHYATEAEAKRIADSIKAKHPTVKIEIKNEMHEGDLNEVTGDLPFDTMLSKIVAGGNLQTLAAKIIAKIKKFPQYRMPGDDERDEFDWPNGYPDGHFFGDDLWIDDSFNSIMGKWKSLGPDKFADENEELSFKPSMESSNDYTSYWNGVLEVLRRLESIPGATEQLAKMVWHGLFSGNVEQGITDIGKPGVSEGAKVDRMVKHIASSEKATGKSKKDAESIAWATANKRGYLDNKNKKKHVAEAGTPADIRAKNRAVVKKIQGKEADIDEGWKSKLAGAALAGAAALGGGAQAQTTDKYDTSWGQSGYDTHIKSDRTLTKTMGSDPSKDSHDFQKRIQSVTGPNAKGEYKVVVIQGNDIVSHYVTKTPPKSWMFKEDITQEDIITKLKAKLGDYLSDLGQQIKKDPALQDKLSAETPGDQVGPPVKTLTTDDGHQISIHGNEDDGFRISIKNRQTPSKFDSLDEAVMACEMYCAHRRKQALNADYVDEA